LAIRAYADERESEIMLRRSLVVVALLVLVAAMAAPVLANPSNGPDEAGAVFRANFPFGLGLEDPEAGLVALGGPPPEQGCLGLGFEEADFQFVETPAGPVKLLIHDVEPFFIYAASSIDEVCEAVLNGGIDPIAVGEAINVRFTDNFDNYEPGSRANPFGANANGTVYDADGNAWSFHGNLKLKIDKDGNFEIVQETIKLNKRGN
jgi:hypothetical protein